MNRYILAERAFLDLHDIHRFLLEHDAPATADSMLRHLRDGIAHLADTPWLGHRREDLTDQNVRFYRVYR